MLRLDGITRREFLGSSGYRFMNLIGLAAAFMPNPNGLAIAQQNIRGDFERSIPYNLKGLPWTEIEDSRGSSQPIDEKIILEESQKRPRLIGKIGRHKETYQVYEFREEPDKAYARNLIGESKISIDSMFRFLNSPYLQIPDMTFNTPRKEDKIKVKGLDGVVFYLISGLREKTVSFYEFDIGGIKVTERYESVKIAHSGFNRPINITPQENQNRIEIETDWPIFYVTSLEYHLPLNIVVIIDAPAIEVLHKSIMPYTIKHFLQRVSDEKLTSHSYIIKLYIDHTHLEEKFVHALSILWLRTYNKDRGIGLTEQELNDKFSRYETISIYRGTNRLASHIAQIGIQKAVELYVTNPNELFKVLK